MTLLRNRNPAARLRALRALREADADAAVLEHMQLLLRDPGEELSLEVVRALARLGANAIPILIGALTHVDFAIRREAAQSLGKVGHESVETVQALSHTLQDPDTMVRMSAAQALGMLGETAVEAIPALVQALKDSNLILCRMASQALSQIGVAAIPALTEALRSPDKYVRREAAWALGKLGPQAAVSAPVLAELLGGSSADVDERSARSAEHEVTSVIRMDALRSDETCHIAMKSASGRFEIDAKVREAAAVALERIRQASPQH